MKPEKTESPELGQPQVKPGAGDDVTHDAVFGAVTEDGPNYRSVGWIATTILMAKSNIGLGVLGIPSAFQVLGLIPGVILILAIGGTATWTTYVIGQFKLNHPDVYSIDDAGFKMFGRVGREILGAVFLLYWIFVTGSGLLSVSIALNAVSTHGACTAVFVVVAAVVAICLNSIRTLGRITILAWIGLFSIIAAIFTVTIAVGIQDRPASAPQTGHWESDYKLFGTPTFLEAATAVSSLIFAFASVSLCFSFAAEMKEPKHYGRAVFSCLSLVVGIYLVIGIVVYYYCGSYVSSPAMGSAGPLMKKVAYGISIPGVMVSTILLSHLAAKYIFVRLLRGTPHLSSNSLRHWVTWFCCTIGVVIVGYIIASAIPVFSTLISLIGALLGTLMTFQPMACMWIYDNWTTDKSRRTPRWYAMVAFSCFVILAATFIMIVGTWGSVVEINAQYKKSGGSAAWSCADNSNSV
ncbi:unnamed protein product [Clonostachys rosea]|uniref:Amino acid transporter transmembrane domain-containing protein n=1 Tax=Bionectria ochroleuca TaxID=29856 RepID=A0ABY6U7D0_BIOOC|nr:unnamed protein product [Clonostachys rosea]